MNNDMLRKALEIALDECVIGQGSYGKNYDGNALAQKVRATLATSAAPERSGKLADERDMQAIRFAAVDGLERALSYFKDKGLNDFDTDKICERFLAIRNSVDCAQPAQEADSSSAAPSDANEKASDLSAVIMALPVGENSNCATDRRLGYTEGFMACRAAAAALVQAPGDIASFAAMQMVDHIYGKIGFTDRDVLIKEAEHHIIANMNKSYAAGVRDTKELASLAAPSPTRESLSAPLSSSALELLNHLHGSAPVPDEWPQPYAGIIVLLETFADIGMTAKRDGKPTPNSELCKRFASDLRAALATPRQTEEGSGLSGIPSWKDRARYDKVEIADAASAAPYMAAEIADWRNRFASTFAPKEASVQGGVPEAEALALEELAKAYYLNMPGAADHPWVDGGNSHKQDEARHAARKLAASPAPTGASHGE